MQPPRFKRVRFLKNVERSGAAFPRQQNPPPWHAASLSLALLVAVLLLPGCGGSTSSGGPSPLEPDDLPETPSSDIRAEAIALLDSMDRAAFDKAFVRLGSLPFTQTVRTERLSESGSVLAFREQRLRYDLNTMPSAASEQATGGSPTYEVTVTRADSSGSFDASVLGRFAPRRDANQPPANIATQAFPDDPAFLSARKREAFHYTYRERTYEGEPAHVVTIWAKRGESGVEQSARFAELTLHRDSHELLAARTVYAERTMLYRQDTRFDIRLYRGPGDVWLPRETTFRATLDMLLRDPRHFRTTSTYTARAMP